LEDKIGKFTQSKITVRCFITFHRATTVETESCKINSKNQSYEFLYRYEMVILKHHHCWMTWEVNKWDFYIHHLEVALLVFDFTLMLQIMIGDFFSAILVVSLKL